MRADFIGKKLMFVTAHPDDESYLFSGVLILNHKAKGQNYIVCATSGEKGKSHLQRKISSKQLASLRKKELIAVSEYLKVKKLFCLDIPDGRVNKNKHKLFIKTEKIIRDCKPDYLFGFGSDGASGHIDHIAAGEVTRLLAEQMNIPFLSFQGAPRTIKEFAATKLRRKEGTYSDDLIRPKSNIIIKIDSNVKINALHFHKSQLEKGNPFINIPTRVVYRMLNYEYFLKKK